MRNSWHSLFRCIFVVVASCALWGCQQVLTVDRIEPSGEQEGAHLRVGQKVKFIEINDGDYYIVLAVADADAPAHTWKIQPYVATRMSPGSYSLKPLIGSHSNPNEEEHTVGMVVDDKGRLKVTLSGAPHPSGVQHNGTAHLN